MTNLHLFIRRVGNRSCVSWSGSAASLLLAGFVLLAGCRPRRPVQEVSVIDSAGVAVVMNSAPDSPLPWTAERVLEIGPLSEEGDGFFGVQGIAVLEGDRIAVLDDVAKRVVVYSGDGEFLAQNGREGSGPGEFQMPFEIAGAPGGGVVVYDVMNRRLERFDADLEPHAPDPLRPDYLGGHLDYAGSFLVVPTRSVMNPEENIHGLLAVSTGDTLAIVRYEREVGGVVTLESCGMSLSGMGPLFEARMLWAAGPDGVVAVVGTDDYQVDLYREPGFGLERRIRRDVPVIEATRALAEASVGDGMRMVSPAGERVCEASEVVEERGFNPEIPPISDLIISPAGQIFLQRWSLEEGDRAMDVLSAEGEYLGTLAPGFPFPEAFLGNNRIVVTEEDELGLRSVVVYRILR